MQELTTTITSDMEEDRERLLQKIRNRATYLAYTTVHNTVARHPTMTEKALGVRRKPLQDYYVGMGYESTVLRRPDDSDVTKVVHTTATMSERAQKTYIKQQRAEYHQVQKKLGEFVLPQSWDIDEHPLLTNTTAVLIRQPYLSAVDLGIFFQKPHTQIERLHQLSSRAPNFVSQLHAFIDGSRALYEEHGILPDVHSPGNLVLDHTSGQLTLLDIHGHDQNWPERQQRVHGHLNTLELALQSIG